MTKFEKGKSGNPAGKPRGALSPSGRLRQAIAADLPNILATLRDRALDGDVQAASLLLSRCLPPLRPQSEAEDVPVTGVSLTERAEGIAAAALSGDLSPTAANELIAVLAQQGRIIETAELAERITRIETALKTTKGVKK